jgi:hypothetical protein
MHKAIAAVAIVAVGLALSGCTSGTPGAKPTSSTSSALDSLLPAVPKALTAATAKKATVNLADSIGTLISSPDVVYVDNHSQLVPATKTDASYYGVLRTITVSASLDPLQQAEAMEKLLVAAGWTEDQTTTDKGKYLAAMSSDPAAPQRSWFLLLGGDSTVAKQPVVTVQLASPDLP